MLKKQNITLNKVNKNLIIDFLGRTLTFIFLFSFLYSCSTSTNYYKECQDCYKLDLIDTVTFSNYNFFVFKDNSNKNYYLVSQKTQITNIDTLKKLSQINIGERIKLTLNMVPTKLIEKSTYTNNSLSGYHYKDVTLWYLDTFRVDLYNSNEIVDKYVRNNLK